MGELGLPPSVCMAFEDTTNGLMAGLAAELPTVVTVSRYSEGEDFTGALAVISDLGEPGAPFRLLQGEAHGRSYIDVALLRLWHENRH
jgi:beta-phosphoglucomutase-like phosphatase (HAD superfamily)